MKARELINLGIAKGPVLRIALEVIANAARDGHGKSVIRREVAAVIADPERHRGHPWLGELAAALAPPTPSVPGWNERAEPAPSAQWGDDLDPKSIEQLQHACRLPITVRGALMPDAHLGYGLPIGGVLATENAVIPYAVGVDIACRMRMSVLDLPVTAIDGQADRLAGAIEDETRFGIGAHFAKPHEHAVLDDDWSICPIARDNKDKARKQLGTSGSGNHFVEFGLLTVEEASELGLGPGRYVALLTHSGSRGAGANIAGHYSKLAMDRHPELPRELRQLAWLDLDDSEGQAYWAAMELMGRYAAANHAVIHRAVARHLRADVIAGVENHHNFAWKETHDGRDVVVHRKGATPAGRGVLGIIPGSMASPAYVVRGRGSTASLESASHGAGRVMSRRAAKQSFTWSQVKAHLAERHVRLLSAGIDEVPMVYKDIESVMQAQSDLVDRLACFEPRIVKMAGGST